MFGKGDKEKEHEEEMREYLAIKGYSQSQTNEIVNLAKPHGLFKKGSFGRPKPYEGPIIFFLKDDGEIEIIEKAQPGIMKTKVGDVERRYIIEPRKVFKFPSPFPDQDLKGWVLYEGEAQAYPTDIVQDVEQFNNILKQVEGLEDLKEWNQNDFWKFLNWKTVGTVLVLAAIAIALITTVGPQYGINLFAPGETTQNIYIINQTIGNGTIPAIGGG